MLDTTRASQDALRTNALEALDIPLLPLEERFDRITRTLARLFGTTAAYLSFIDADTQWFKSIHGADLLSLPIQESFCQKALETGQLFICEDISHNSVLSKVKFALPDGKKAHFYAGLPLRYQGQIVGTLGLVHSELRTLSDDEIRAFKDIGGWAQTELIAPRTDSFVSSFKNSKTNPHEQIDPNTRLWNTESIRKILTQSFTEHLLHLTPISVLMASIDRLSEIEELYGNKACQQVLQTIAAGMRRYLRADDSIGLFADDTFLIILNDCEPQRSEKVANRIASLMSALQFPHIEEKHQPVVRVGGSRSDETNFKSEHQLIDLATHALLETHVFEVTHD